MGSRKAWSEKPTIVDFVTGGTFIRGAGAAQSILVKLKVALVSQAPLASRCLSRARCSVPADEAVPGVRGCCARDGPSADVGAVLPAVIEQGQVDPLLRRGGVIALPGEGYVRLAGDADLVLDDVRPR